MDREQIHLSPRLILSVILLAVLCFGAILYSGPALGRPFEGDESRTINSHTSFGYFKTRADLVNKPRHSIIITGKGLMRSMLNWKSWDAHIGDCWAISVSSFFLGFDERAARLPSLLAALGAVAGLMIWGYRHTRSPALVALMGVSFLVNPEIFYYAQTARGYTIAIFLMVLNLLLFEGQWHRMKYYWMAGAFAILSYLQILNLLSMLFMWVVPLEISGVLWYLFVFNRDSETNFSLRKRLSDPALHGWIFQCAVALVVFGQFVLDHFLILISNISRYGLPVESIGDLFMQTGVILRYLFPGLWSVVAGVGALGWIVMIFSKDRHWLGITALLSIVITLGFGLVSHKLPYPRNCLIYVPLVLTGVVWLWKGCQTLQGHFSRLSRGIVAGVLCLPLVGFFTNTGYRDFNLASGFALTGKVVKQRLESSGKTARDVQILAPFYNDDDDQFVRVYYPDSNRFFIPSADKARDLDVYIPCEVLPEGFGFNCKGYETLREYTFHFFPPSWSQYIVYQNPGAVLYSVPMRWRGDLPAEFGRNECAIAAWIPPKNAPLDVANFLFGEFAAHKNEEHGDYDVKTLDGRKCAFFLVSNAAEFEFAKGLIEKLNARVQGETFFFEERSKLSN